jgi:putative inorganic carbon (hco3(-)) transporter
VQNTQLLRISQTLALLTFVALVTLLPSVQFMPKSIIWFNDRQRLLELLLLSFVLLDAILVGLANIANQVPIPPKIRNAFFVLLGLTIVSCSLAQSPRHALVETSVFAGLCYLALFVTHLFNENKQVFFHRLIYALWASILLYMLSFYTGYITATVFKTPLNWPFPFTGFTNVRSFNQYQLWSLGLICIPLLINDLKKNARIWLQIALAGWWVLLFYSASRGVLLAWLVSILATALTYQKSAWPFLRQQIIQITTGFLGYNILFKVMPALLQHNLVTGTVMRETTNDRVGLWSQAITLIREFPLLGVGPMHFAWFSQSNAHPHNSVLQLAAEFGLPATLIVLTIVAYGLNCWFRKFNSNTLKKHNKLDSQLAIILFFTITINAAYSMVDGVIVTPISQVLMFTVIGLMIGHYTYDLTSNIKDANLRPEFRQIFAGLVLLAMIWSTLPEVVKGLSSNEKGFSMGYTAAGPRFWRETK